MARLILSASASMPATVFSMPRIAPSPKYSPTAMASRDGERMPRALLMAPSALMPTL